jgi:hypothetical protein
LTKDLRACHSFIKYVFDMLENIKEEEQLTEN